MKRVYWGIGIASCLILSLLIFHRAFFTFLATWSLKVYSTSEWGQPLHYESLVLNGNQLVLVQPQFEHGSSFTAKQISLRFYINIWKRQLHIDIDFDQPHWHFQSSVASQWEKWAKLFSREDRWIKTHPNFHINEGLLTWILEDSHSLHRLKFDLEINHQEGGYVKLHFDSPDTANELLVLKTLKTREGVEVNCRCENIHCYSLMAFAQFLGFDASPWSVTSGSMQGELTAIFPGMQRPYLEGDLIAENIDFQGMGSALKGQIGKMHLQLKKNHMAYEFKDSFPTTIGKLEILEPASLIYQSAVQGWGIRQIQGSLELNDVETAFIDLQALVGNALQPSKWNLQGMANLNAQDLFNVDALLFCTKGNQSDGKIHLAVNQVKERSKHFKMQCEKLSYTECDFLQTLLSTYWPVCSALSLQEGELSALIEADIMQEGLGELYIKQFEASHLRSKLKPWNMMCYFGQVRGHGRVQLGREDFWDSIHAGLHLEDGQIEFEDLSPPLPITDIQGHLLIQQGCVEHSLVTLQVAGLKGKMDVEWGDHKQLLTFKLDGIVEDLEDLFPSILQAGLRKHFYHNRLLVLANLKRQNRQMEMDGTFHIQRAQSEQIDLIHFGCELKKVQNSLESKYVPVGWFHAHKLPLNKFLSPFIFRNGILEMSGEAEFKGSFDDQFLLIKYDADHLKIENKDLCIDLPNVHSPVPGQLIGSHRMNLHSYEYEGTLPLQSASYYEKNTGLVFHDIQGLATFTNGFIRILPIEADCEGISFNGELELDYRDPAPGVFDLTIRCPTLSGKVSQVQRLLAHLDQPSLLHNMPLEGDISGKGNGLFLKFTFVPKDYQLQADVQGMITEGSLSFGEADMALRGMDMNVSYHHDNELLELSEIQGTVLVGKPRCVEEYLLAGNHIRFHHLAQPDIDLDIAVKNRERELLRLVGHTKDEEEGVKSLYLDQRLSHFSCIYPHVWRCCLKDWSNIEQFEFRSQFDLQKFLQDLQCFRQTGLLFLSHRVIDKISQFLPVDGQGFLALHYHPDQSYTYHLEGLNIKQGDSSEHYGLLKGSKQDKKWIIDQLQWDEWNVSAELHQIGEKWRIPFLGLKIGQTVLLGLEGDWLQEQALLQAKLKFCQVDLSQLDHFEALRPFFTKWWPKGILNATGEMEWNLLATRPLEGCKASLQAEVKNFTLRDYLFRISAPFKMSLQPHHHFYLENVQVELSSQKRQSYLDVKQFQYNVPQEEISSLEMDFQIPHQQLESVGEIFHHYFPDILETSVKNILVHSKQQGQLKGILTMDNPTANQRLLRLELEDGLYTFKKREYPLKKFQLQIKGDELQFSAFSQQEQCSFQVIGQAKWPSCQEGQCQLMSTGSIRPLIMKWANQLQGGFVIRSLQGEFSGCSFLLRENREAASNNDWMALQGQVTVDFNRLSSLLAPNVAEAIQKLKVGSPYSFVGRFWMNPDWGETFLETLSFKGKLLGEEVILKGYRVKNLQADLQYVPSRLDIQNFSIQDPAGSMKAVTGLVVKNPVHDQWDFFIPRLTIKNLRPNLLRDTDTYIQSNPIHPSVNLATFSKGWSTGSPFKKQPS